MKPFDILKIRLTLTSSNVTSMSSGATSLPFPTETRNMEPPPADP